MSDLTNLTNFNKMKEKKLGNKWTDLSDLTNLELKSYSIYLYIRPFLNKYPTI